MITKEKTKVSPRLDWLDRVKGIGILFVVIGHVYVEDGLFSRVVHALNVPLFFIASGYLDCTKREWERGGRELLGKKVRSILFPYFAYSALMMLWLLVRFFVFHYGSIYEILHCLADIFCLEGISVLWFLSALFIGQLLVLFSLKLLLQGKINHQPLILFLLFTVFAFALTRFTGWAQSNSGGIVIKLLLKASRILGRGAMAGSFLLIGILIRLAEEHFIGNHREKNTISKTVQRTPKTVQRTSNIMQKTLSWIIPILCFPLALFGLWLNGLRDFHYLSFGFFPLYIANAVLGFMIAFFACRWMAKDFLLVFLGKNSLVIMATHLIFLDFINIMAILLSTPAGRYLGDEREIKLLILMAAEILLVGLCHRRRC